MKKLAFVAIAALSLTGNALAQNTIADAIIVKYDNKGNVAWEKSFGEGKSNNSYSSVTIVSDGMVAVGGPNKFYMKKANPDDKAVAVKYDINGNVAWEKRGSEEGYYSSVTTVSDGVVAVGYYSSGDFFSKNYVSTAVIVKYDDNGNVVWEKKNNSDASSHYSSITTVSGGVVAVGRSGNIAVIVKYDDDGNMVWEKKGSVDKYGLGSYSSLTTVSSGVVSVGQHGGSADIADIAIIVKYDNKGNVVWEKKGDEGRYSSVTAISDGMVAISLSNIVKYNNSGNVVWKKKNNSDKNAFNSYSSIAAVPDGVIAVGSKSLK